MHNKAAVSIELQLKKALMIKQDTFQFSSYNIYTGQELHRALST